MKQLIPDNVRNYLKGSYHNRRQNPLTAANEPKRVLSTDNGYTAIRFPTQSEETTGRFEIALPEIPYREEEAGKPVMLFASFFPKDSNGQPITDTAQLQLQANHLKIGVHYDLSSSAERPHIVTLIDVSDPIWQGVTEIHYLFWGLGSVLTADDYAHFQNENIKTKNLETEKISCDEADIAAGEIRGYLHNTIDIGIIQMWGSSELPKNADGTSDYLHCHGQTVRKTDYPKLFAAWGVTASTMTLPDMRCRSPIGVGETGADDDKTAFAFKGTAGELKHTLTIEEMPEHNHQIWLSRGNTVWSGGQSVLGPSTNWGERWTNPAGKGKPHSVLHPVIGVYFIVKVK